MNTTARDLQDITEGTDIYSVLGEPEDPGSDWHELRSAQLSGNDYIFLSARINTKLANKSSLTEFVLDIYQIMETSNERAKIFIYSEHILGKPEFAEFSVNWSHGEVKDFHIRPVKNLEQKEFIRTIFEHSGQLVGAA